MSVSPCVCGSVCLFVCCLCGYLRMCQEMTGLRVQMSIASGDDGFFHNCLCTATKPSGASGDEDVATSFSLLRWWCLWCLCGCEFQQFSRFGRMETGFSKVNWMVENKAPAVAPSLISPVSILHFEHFHHQNSRRHKPHHGENSGHLRRRSLPGLALVENGMVVPCCEVVPITKLYEGEEGR